MVKTFGLTHIGLAVRDAERSLRFYRQVFGVRILWRGKGEIQVQTPGRRDVIAFVEMPRKAGKIGGVTHFGFRLTSPRDLDAAAKSVRRAGGQVLRRGEFVPGEPYLFVEDPDGYEVEIWYE
ncbi:MAG TPA: VOC family protein [Thermoplasmata archaeon]|nr:VOC family protein [Thermoplasmata archaeon]